VIGKELIMKNLAFGLLALLLATAPLGADERLKMYLSVTGAIAPANVSVQTIVQPSSRNRAIRVVAESEDFFRSSTMSLNGESAPRVTTITFPQMPSGQYHIEVAVLAVDGSEIARAQKQFVIW
jgi:hypothetical protein